MVRAEGALRRRSGPQQLPAELCRRVLAERHPVANGWRLKFEVGVRAQLQSVMTARLEHRASLRRRTDLREAGRRRLELRLDRRAPGLARRQDHQADFGQRASGGMPVAMIMVVLVTVFVAVMVLVLRGGSGVHNVDTSRQPITARPFKGPLRLQEIRVPCQRALEIEGAEIEYLIQRQLGPARAHQARGGVDRAQFLLDPRQLRGADQVGLVEQQHVGKADLVGGGRHFPQLGADMRGVDQRNDGIQLVVVAQVCVDEEGLRHRARIGKPRGLDQHVVEAIAALAQLAQHPDQVAAHGAADAAIGGLEDFLLGADHQLVVDRDFAEFVLDHGDALAVLLRQDAIEQRGLAGAEKPGEHRHRDARARAAQRALRERSRRSSPGIPGTRSRFSSSGQPARARHGAPNLGRVRAKAAAAPRCTCTARAVTGMTRPLLRNSQLALPVSSRTCSSAAASCSGNCIASAPLSNTSSGRPLSRSSPARHHWTAASPRRHCAWPRNAATRRVFMGCAGPRPVDGYGKS